MKVIPGYGWVIFHFRRGKVQVASICQCTLPTNIAKLTFQWTNSRDTWLAVVLNCILEWSFDSKWSPKSMSSFISMKNCQHYAKNVWKPSGSRKRPNLIARPFLSASSTLMPTNVCALKTPHWVCLHSQKLGAHKEFMMQRFPSRGTDCNEKIALMEERGMG